MTWLGYVWIALVVFALAIFVGTTVWLVKRILGLYRSVRDIDFPSVTDKEETSLYVSSQMRKPAPTGSEATLSQARLAHQDVKATRRLHRNNRLDAALDRWAGYGLVTRPR